VKSWIRIRIKEMRKTGGVVPPVLPFLRAGFMVRYFMTHDIPVISLLRFFLPVKNLKGPIFRAGFLVLSVLLLVTKKRSQNIRINFTVRAKSQI
jgi:hypothetical protein